MLIRPRRNRLHAGLRAGVEETHIGTKHLIVPIFLVDGVNVRESIPSLKMANRLSLDQAFVEIEDCISMGLDKFIIFPVVKESLKDSIASYSYSADNFYLHAAKEMKIKFPEILLISDVALDPYSSDGHDGIVRNGEILNDETLPILVKMALAQASHGFDIIGPSDMMDGRVHAIREALEENGFVNTGIMSYTAKYASAFYGPFRDALDSAPKFGDKKTYQMNPANKREALLEGELDTMEGADFLMVKPALHYLDVIQTMKENFTLPIVAYHVSGECAMLQAACDNGWLDFDTALFETLLSIRRAGADFIITYFAKSFAANQFKK